MSLFWSHQAKRGWGTDSASDLDTTGLLSGTVYANTSASEIYIWSGYEWKQVQVGQEAHIVDADGTLGDATAKINAVLLALEALGLLANA